MQSMARSLLISPLMHLKKAFEWPARMKHKNRIVNKFLISKQKKPRYLFLLLHSINLCVTLLFLKAFFFLLLSSSYCFDLEAQESYFGIALYLPPRQFNHLCDQQWSMQNEYSLNDLKREKSEIWNSCMDN